MFKIGMAIWGHKGWIGNFFPPGSPQKDLLKLYGQRVTAVEGNTTFYAVPTQDTVRKWSQQVPDAFRFCPKLHRDITHDGRLHPKTPLAQNFLNQVKTFKEKLGPCFAQLPPSYGPDMLRDLANFLEPWPRDTHPIAVEVRNPGWFNEPHADSLDRLLTKMNVGRALLDTRPIYENNPSPALIEACRKPPIPLAEASQAPFVIVRYISHPDLHTNEPYLIEWARRVDRWLDTNTDVYFFFHCPIEEQSPTILRRFHQILQARKVDVPPLPWDSIKAPPSQLTLF